MAHIDWKYFKSEEAPEQKLILEPLTQGPEMLPAYCSETLKWYEESWDGDPQAPFIAAVAEYYNQIYLLFTENRPHDIKIKQVRQQLAVIEEAHRQRPSGSAERVCPFKAKALPDAYARPCRRKRMTQYLHCCGAALRAQTVHPCQRPVP